MKFQCAAVLALALAAIVGGPAFAQPAPPSGPGSVAGPANPGHPLLAGTPESRKREACMVAWQAERDRSGRRDSAAYLRFMQACLEPK